LKRVGIMSMQRIYNYGSSLQAYGLRRLIESVDPSAEVSFVDYVPGQVLVADPAATTPASPLRRTVSKVRAYGSVPVSLPDKLRFLNHKRSYGRRNFPLLGISSTPNHDLDLDVQVIGSDEVFNCVQSNTNVGYSRDLFGHGSPARRVVSYAGSFGNTTLAKISDAGIADDLRSDFARFAHISVRDRNSAEVVEALTGRAPTLNVDPVLAYEYMAREPRIPAGRQSERPYVIVYGYAGRLDHRENELLREYAHARGAEILCFGGVQECCDRFVDCDPFELLAYFRDAEAVVTDTFHGTIFALVNHRPFATIIRRSSGHGYGNEEKLGFLLELFGLSSQRVDDLAEVGDILSHPIDWDAVDRVLEAERERTRDYLVRAIN
jgi:Polysaccharide pyruvyl transferase